MAEKKSERGTAPRHRMDCLSGVACPSCHGQHVISHVIHRRLTWMCGFCSTSWQPSLAEVQQYNGRVRSVDRIVAFALAGAWTVPVAWLTLALHLLVGVLVFAFVVGVVLVIQFVLRFLWWLVVEWWWYDTL